jgi:flavin reductase (DIM6/NTAB) family NADH-FMN oxidoreductase RutF
MPEGGLAQRSLFRRWPTGVAVVVAEAGGRRAGLTVSSLTSLSLDPPLVGISIAHVASLHDLLQDAGTWAASVLSGEQDWLARHFAQSLSPAVLWDGPEVRADDPRLLVGAAGWLAARTVRELATGDHTLFVAEVLRLEQGHAASSLAYIHRTYRAI